MKLTPDQIAFIHRNLCEAGYTASADALVEHIRDVTQERDTITEDRNELIATIAKFSVGDRVRLIEPNPDAGQLGYVRGWPVWLPHIGKVGAQIEFDYRPGKVAWEENGHFEVVEE